MNKPDLIRHLIAEGWPHKIVCIITGSRQPYVSKIAAGKLKPEIEPAANFDTAELTRYLVIKRIYELRALPTQGVTEQDQYYIHLLKFLMVDKDKIIQIYNDLSKKRFAQIYTSKKFDFRKFHASLVDLKQEDFDLTFLQTADDTTMSD
jgi:hypothetical protein